LFSSYDEVYRIFHVNINFVSYFTEVTCHLNLNDVRAISPTTNTVQLKILHVLFDLEKIAVYTFWPIKSEPLPNYL